MKPTAWALLLLITASLPAAAQPKARVVLETNGSVYVGQQVRVDVTVLVPNYFLSAPQFPTFDIPGTIVTLLDENATNSTETIDGQTYAGVHRSYAVMPQRPGTFVLPPARITFQYAAEPGTPGVPGSVALPPKPFIARSPPGAQGNTGPTLITKVTIRQTLDEARSVLKVHDALTRKVETFASNTQAMLIPPPTFDAPLGVRVYRRDPVLSDTTTDRDGFTGGKRVDEAIYEFEQPGTYTLPAIKIGWYDRDTGTQQVATAPAVSVSVIAAAVSPMGIAPPPDDAGGDAGVLSVAYARWRRWIWVPASFVAGLVILWGLRRRLRRFGDWLQARRRVWRASEAAAFGRLKRACLGGDPAMIYSAVTDWARVRGFPSIPALCAQAPALRCEVTKLEQHLFGRDRYAITYNGSGLLAAARRARAPRRTTFNEIRGVRAVLPPLNP
jgi:BatD DUF11 like domain